MDCPDRWHFCIFTEICHNDRNDGSDFGKRIIPFDDPDATGKHHCQRGKPLEYQIAAAVIIRGVALGSGV